MRQVKVGILLHSGEEVETFIRDNGGSWPIRGYVNTRKLTYQRKRDGVETVRYVHSLFLTVYQGYTGTPSRKVNGDSVSDASFELSSYSNEELGYI